MDTDSELKKEFIDMGLAHLAYTIILAIATDKELKKECDDTRETVLNGILKLGDRCIEAAFHIWKASSTNSAAGQRCGKPVEQ
jgi:hypothetical protein